MILNGVEFFVTGEFNELVQWSKGGCLYG
jgi:hypothetical protein